MNETEQMLTSIRKCRRIDLYVDPKELDSRQTQRFQEMRSRRSSGEPLQYILGECEFMGLAFKVDPRVLIPRPETEILVETVLEKVRTPVRVLDAGTGSGNIAVSLAKFLPGSEIMAIDISGDALTVARGNARRNGVQGSIRFRKADMRTFKSEERLDVIVSNPPYIPTTDIFSLPDDVRQEPFVALNGGEDGLDYFRSLAALAQRVLVPSGLLICEIGDGQAENLRALFGRGWVIEEFRKDYRRTERVLVVKRMLRKENLYG